MTDDSPKESIEPQLNASSHAGISLVPQAVAPCDNNGTKEASASVFAAGEIAVDNDTTARQPAKKKPIRFHLVFLAINIACFIFALDSTSLSVAIPVRYQPTSCLSSSFNANSSSQLLSSSMARRCSLFGLESPFF